MSTDTSAKQSNQSSENRRIVVRWAIRETLGVVMLAVLLFLPAGRLDWVWGWALVGIMALWAAATGVVSVRRSPELLAERLGPREGAKRWDTAIMGIVGVLTLVRCVVAGLDVRFGWTEVSLPLHVIALVVAALGYALVVWATAVNAYFSQIVRIQAERGHSVATGGPYQVVRHPGYVGTILFELAVPVMLGSWWALVPGGVNALLFVIRTALEDRTLREELAGYEDYARRVRYRLMPGVW